ncbi:MAG: glycosyltransferase [Phycisphaeraceae bacterium]|nr:glycosyltransferase [Phycisphaeraceae bacterium]
MQIVHVIRSLDPRYGGPPRVVTRLAAAHAGLGHQVTVVSTELDAERSSLARSALEEVPGSERLAQVTIPEKTVTPLGSLRRGGRERMPSGDLVYLHGVWDPLLRAAARVAHARGVPYVIRPAGMLTPWSLRHRRWKKRLALAAGWKRMLDQSLYVHALNRDEAETMAPVRLRAPIEIIPNGIFLEEVGALPPRGAFRREHPELGQDPFVLFLSRLHWGKGLDLLGEAFAQVVARKPDLRLVVAGPDAGVGAEFEAQTKRLGIESRVHRVGAIYGPHKIAALVDALAFCLPSEHEAFSVAITEALACGCPVVISPECHFPEVTEVGAGLIVPRNPEKIADAIERVLADSAAAARMGEAGRTLVRERFTWPEIAARSLELVQIHMARRSAVAGS